MKKIIYAILAFATISMQPLSAANEWIVEKYGAVSDGKTVNTKAIQQAIDECSAAGGGNVVLSSGIYMSGTLKLKDNVTLELRRGVVLRGTIDPRDYYNVDYFVDATGQSRGECLVGAVEAKNIGICGTGVIDGDGTHFRANLTRKRLTEWGATEKEIADLSSVRPFLVRIVRCEDVNIKDVTMKNPAAWTCHLYQSKDIKVDGITIYAHGNRNNDGIDLDSCDGAVITNCNIDSGDDAMCFKTTSPIACQNVVVSKCRLKSHWGAIKFGTESMGDFRNIKVEDCYVYDTHGGGIKVLSMDGSNIYNVRINKVEMVNVDMPIFIRLGERLRTYRKDDIKQPIGSIDRLYINNIKATQMPCDDSRVNPPSGIIISGTPNARIGNVYLNNIDITVPGGGTSEMKSIVVDEQPEKYPEFTHFGVQPAYGFNARHADSLVMKSVSIKLAGEDGRDFMKLEDINSIPLQFPLPAKN
ncbi:MAG: glycosyl hydrolase family 28 protein [Rikenellaceae bacterium]